MSCVCLFRHAMSEISFENKNLFLFFFFLFLSLIVCLGRSKMSTRTKRSRPEELSEKLSSSIGLACAIVLQRQSGKLEKGELVRQVEVLLGREEGELSEHKKAIKKAETRFYKLSAKASESIVKKPRSKSTAAASSSASSAKPAAEPKKTTRASKAPIKSTASFPLGFGGKKRVEVKSWQGNQFGVDLREYYEDKNTGESKPGKGIFLKPEQWALLVANSDKIDELLERPL